MVRAAAGLPPLMLVPDSVLSAPGGGDGQPGRLLDPVHQDQVVVLTHRDTNILVEEEVGRRRCCGGGDNGGLGRMTGGSGCSGLSCRMAATCTRLTISTRSLNTTNKEI